MINEFIAKIKTEGIAKTNRFKVRIPLTFMSNNEQDTIALFCDAVNLPGVSMQTTPHLFYGESREMPYGRLFDPVQLSFYVDSNLVVKRAFDVWFSQIQDPTTRTMGYYNHFVQPIDIEVYGADESETPIYTLTLHEAYPKAISSINLASESRELMKLQVGIQYKYYTTTETDTVEALPPLLEPGSETPLQIPVESNNKLVNLKSYIDKRPIGSTMIEDAKRAAQSNVKVASTKIYDKFKTMV